MTYGFIEFKEPLTEINVAMLCNTTGNLYEVGDTRIELEGEYATPDEIIDCLKHKTIIEGRLNEYCNYEDYLTLFRNGKWQCYDLDFLPDFKDNDLIYEIEQRGYKVTKGE